MKRFLSVLIIMTLLVSMLVVTTAFAGASISGSSSVQAGRSYTYTGSASYTGVDMVGKIEGLGQVKSFYDDSGSGENGSLSGSASITVSIPSGASPGDTYSIKVSGQYSVKEADGTYSGHSFSKTLTITVATAPTSTPRPTRDPNATPRPTEPPTEWELAEADVEAADDGATVQVTITEDPKIPESMLSLLRSKKTPLVVDFGTYKCMVDPAALTEFAGIGSLSLALNFEKDEALSAVAGAKDAYQLHFGHQGELPGKFTFSFPAPENVTGDVVYLYYYYGMSEVVEGVQSAIVDSNGWVSFDIYHCSSYFVSNEVLEGAVDSFNPEADSEIAALTIALEESQGALAQAEEDLAAADAALAEAQANAAQAQSDADDAKANADAALAQAGESEAAPPPAPAEISLAGLIAALAGAALLAMLLTMLFTRSGFFRRSAEAEQAHTERLQAKAQAKADARENAERVQREKAQARLDKEIQRRRDQEQAAQEKAEKRLAKKKSGDDE